VIASRAREATGGIDKARPELKKDKDTQKREKMRTTWSDIFCYLIVAILAVLPTLPRAGKLTCMSTRARA